MKWVYELMYRCSFVPIPYDSGPRAELVGLVESGRIKPCRAIDLGSGTASNLERIMGYYSTPCFIFMEQTVFFNPTDEAKRVYFSAFLERYRAAGIAFSETPELNVLPLGDTSAMVSVRWVSRGEDGVVIWDFWDSYLWIRMNGARKILGDTVHDR